MNFFDAHFHLIPSVKQCGSASVLDFYKNENFAITCAHSPEEFSAQKKFIKENNLENKIFEAFGIHPQQPEIAFADFLERLLKNKEIKFIGETGLDFFSEEYKLQKSRQLEAFHVCLELAVYYKVPLIIHNRKGLDEMFKDIRILKNVPLVLFHSFAFSSREAVAILNHEVNAVFSFSKQLLNGNKKSISCVKELPAERIFLETDAPFQTLKNEEKTLPSEIERVYKACAEIKKMSVESLCLETADNYKKYFLPFTF